jgi:heme A synthase
MRRASLIFRITSLFVFVQILLGGLLTFDFVTAAPHIIFGFLVLVLAILAAMVAWTSKPAFRPIRMLSMGLVVLVLVQVVLGFATLGSGSQIVAWLHFVVGMGIYGMSIAGTFMAMRWDTIARSGVPPGGPEGQAEVR